MIVADIDKGFDFILIGCEFKLLNKQIKIARLKNKREVAILIGNFIKMDNPTAIAIVPSIVNKTNKKMRLFDLNVVIIKYKNNGQIAIIKIKLLVSKNDFDISLITEEKLIELK